LKLRKMVTYFNKKDLVKFGNYLLSDERTQRIKDNLQVDPCEDYLNERLKIVYHADVENFLETIKKVDWWQHQ